jgi:hypothetical protein
MPERRLLHFDIDDRQREQRDLVAPDDFVLRRRDTPCEFPTRALAYCADMQAERVLFSLHGADMGALFDAPFLYAAQLRDARQVVTVPFEQLAALDAGTPCRPSLIFSPGRTGSTLLARLLAECGVPCASEPDMLTQVCRFRREERMRIGPDMEVALLHTCLAALCRALGAAPFVKLRSHCNARPLPLLAAAGGGRAFLLWRRLAPWALSRHRTFGETPASVAAVLRQALDAADKLLGEPAPIPPPCCAAACPTPCWIWIASSPPWPPIARRAPPSRARPSPMPPKTPISPPPSPRLGAPPAPAPSGATRRMRC